MPKKAKKILSDRIAARLNPASRKKLDRYCKANKINLSEALRELIDKALNLK